MLPYYPVITGPIALYNNVPVNPEYYKPRQWFISTITLGTTTLVTTTVDHDYVIGQLCRLLIPQANGCRQLNETTSYVIDIPNPNQVILRLNSYGIDAFTVSTQPTQPQILGIGDINLGNINASGNLNTSTLIPGSYQNISP